MNRARRKALEDLGQKLTELKELLDLLLEEERDYLANMPDSLSQSDRGQMAEDAISNLEAAADSLDAALTSIDEASA